MHIRPYISYRDAAGVVWTVTDRVAEHPDGIYLTAVCEDIGARIVALFRRRDGRGFHPISPQLVEQA